MMTSKEKIIDIKYLIMEHYSDKQPLEDYQKASRNCFFKYCDDIKQDLERSETLEEENQELKNRLANEQLAFDKLFESNQKLSELYAKLKKTIDILKDKLVLDIETEIAKENDIELIGYWLVEGDTQKLYTIITKKEYELLKEILEDES